MSSWMWRSMPSMRSRSCDRSSAGAAAAAAAGAAGAAGAALAAGLTGDFFLGDLLVISVVGFLRVSLLEVPHEGRQRLHALLRHCVVNRGAHAAEDAVALEP